MPGETSLGGPQRAFDPTLWTRVLKAKEHSPDALNDLIRSYWKPVYFYVRRWGEPVEGAKDLTQGFFAAFLERDFLKGVEKEKGRFRTFLLTALRHFLINDAERARAKKRGGGKAPLSLDFDSAETRYSRTPAAKDDLDAYFRRQWALTVLERALDRLSSELPAERFEAMRAHLSPEEAPSIAETASDLGLTEANVKVVLHRARQRYRDLIREEVRSGLGPDGDVESEIRELFDSL